MKVVTAPNCLPQDLLQSRKKKSSVSQVVWISRHRTGSLIAYISNIMCLPIFQKQAKIFLGDHGEEIFFGISQKSDVLWCIGRTTFSTNVFPLHVLPPFCIYKLLRISIDEYNWQTIFILSYRSLLSLFLTAALQNSQSVFF